MLLSRCLRSVARLSLLRHTSLPSFALSNRRQFADVPRSPDSGEPLTRELIDKLVDEHLLTPNYHRSLKADPFAPIAPMPVKALTDAEKKAMLTFLPDWLEVANRNAIFRSFQFTDFKSAFHFMTRVAIFAEAVGHHPEWFNVYNRLEVTLTTHDASGVSMRDITMAAYLDRLFQTPIDAVENLSRWRATDKLFAAEDTLLNLRPELAVPQMVRHAPVALMPDDQVSAHVLEQRIKKRELSMQRAKAREQRRIERRLARRKQSPNASSSEAQPLQDDESELLQTDTNARQL